MFATGVRRGRAPLFARSCLALLLAACGSGEDDGEDGSGSDDQADSGDSGDGGDGAAGTCEVPEYGDGTCQVDIACDAPDIDCFVFFDDQSSADAWFSEFEELLAAEEFREPRAIVPDTDPGFQRMRALLDDGWAAYQETYPVADLADRRPALVVIEDPTANAFVIPDLDSGNAGFAVMVHTGLLARNASDQAMLGLVMHELEHAVGLHIVGDVKERMRSFYLADGTEPFGFEEPEDPAAREHGVAWRELAAEAGPFPYEELGGLPLSSSQLGQIFNTVVQGPDLDPVACEAALVALDDVSADIGASFSPLYADLRIADRTIRPRIDDALIALRDECLADFTLGFVDVLADIAGSTPEEVRAQLSPEDLELVDGVHFIDAVADLTFDRRARMRDIEITFEEEIGLPWSALRFYSYEEAADDATVPVLDAIGVAPDGLGEFLFDVLDPDTRSICGEHLDVGQVPPYGADLSDEHHATCWRVDHVSALAASDALPRPSTGAAARRRAPTPRAARMPIPPRLSDLIVY